MADKPQVILSGFADEAAYHKTAVEQFAPFAAMGLHYYSLRAIDAGRGIKNVLQLTTAEIQKIRHQEDEYDLSVASIGSPIGKVKLLDVDDGTKNAYVPFARYLAKEVHRACELAHAFETKLIRGFSFYPPAGDDPWKHLPQAVDQIGQIAETCHRSDLTFGLEVEANLVGRDGLILAEIHRQVNHPALMLVFDAANLICQGFTTSEVFAHYQAMKPALGWMHIKDYRVAKPSRVAKASAGKGAGAKSAPAKGKLRAGVARKHPVDEEALRNFVPIGMGNSGYEEILRDFAESIPALEKRLRRRGIPGVFVELEPHLKAGGQFGGASGPDGMGVALRALLRILDFVGIGYELRSYEDVRAGFEA
jgi:sugar phosphate isomerase/epimerase